MVTYEDSTQVVRKRLADQHANKMDSRTILTLKNLSTKFKFIRTAFFIKVQFISSLSLAKDKLGVRPRNSSYFNKSLSLFRVSTPVII